MAEARLVIAATFDPPGAHESFARWRTLNAPLLDDLRDEDVRIDTGRAEGGDFIRVWLPPEIAGSAAQ